MALPTIFYTDGFDDYASTSQAGGSGYWPYNPSSGNWSLTTGRKSYKQNAAFNNTLGIIGRPVPDVASEYLQVGAAVRRETGAAKSIFRFFQYNVGGSRPTGNDENTGLFLSVNSNGQLVVISGLAITTGTLLGVSTETIGQDEWHFVEMAAKFARDATGWVKVWLNGKLVISAENVQTTKNTGLGMWSSVELHSGSPGVSDGTNGVLRIDDLYMGVADSTFATAQAIGDSRVFSFVPTDPVDVADWTNEGGAADIPEALADTDDATYAETDQVGVDLLVESDNTFDITPRVIHAVALVARPRKTDIGVVQVKPKLGTTSGAVTPDDPHFLSESFEGIQWTFDQNPETTAPWEATDFADFVFGLHVVDPEA